jgi:3-oxoacyl-[acyl-carrier-protein] synthase III
MLNAALLGTGACAGSRAMASVEIDARLGKPAGWLEGACGVVRRPVVAEGETQEGMAVAAARRALADANVEARDIDLLLFASAVGRQPIPSTATLIKRELGLNNCAAPAFDVNATCLSAVAAMEVAALYIGAGRARHVLIVASEIATRALPWTDDPATAGLFGDGAAAVVMGPARGTGLHLKDVTIETWAEGYDYCALPAGGTRYDLHTNRDAFEANAFFRMDGHALFKLTRTKLPDFIGRLLARAGWTQDAVDLVIPHQASPLALEHMIRKCGFARERVVSTVTETGNLVAASIPMTLDTARREGRIKAGSKVMLIGTSAGVSIGGAILEA